MNKKPYGKIIVTGCTGMDGSNMVDFLLKNTEYDIVGMVRRLSVPNGETPAVGTFDRSERQAGKNLEDLPLRPKRGAGPNFRQPIPRLFGDRP